MHKRIATVALFACLPSVVAATDLLIASYFEDYSKLHEQITNWQELTGHRVVRFPLELGYDGNKAIEASDLLYLPATEVFQLVAEKKITPLPVPADYEIGKLVLELFSVKASDGQPQLLVAIPHAISLPFLWYRTDHAARIQLKVSANPSWEDLRNYVILLNDAIDGVSGICPNGEGIHGLLIRAMIAEAGYAWLDEGGEQLSAIWSSIVEQYAGIMVAGAPAKIADLSVEQIDELIAQGKCSIWFSDEPATNLPEKVSVMAMPGAMAAVLPSIRLLALSESSERTELAQEFINWIVYNESNPTSTKVATISSLNYEINLARRRVLEQQNSEVTIKGIVSSDIDWKEFDRIIEPALLEVIKGIKPADEALAEIQLVTNP